ncbi:hypothetical protein [Nautilia profundicola]|nr:hypothetical protein [Nautilia profundicola]
MPKKELFFLIQNYLKKENIYINTKINQTITGLIFNNGQIYYKNINVCDFNKGILNIYLIQNNLYIKDLKINIGNYFIKKAYLSHNILDPFIININASANFGDIKGKIDIKNSFLKIYIINIKNQTIKKLLKKDKKGYYYYVNF